MPAIASKLERFHDQHSKFNQRGDAFIGVITQFRLLFVQPKHFGFNICPFFIIFNTLTLQLTSL